MHKHTSNALRPVSVEQGNSHTSGCDAIRKQTVTSIWLDSGERDITVRTRITSLDNDAEMPSAANGLKWQILTCTYRATDRLADASSAGARINLMSLIMTPFLVKPPSPQDHDGQKGKAGVTNVIPVESPLMRFQKPVCNHKICNTNDCRGASVFCHQRIAPIAHGSRADPGNHTAPVCDPTAVIPTRKQPYEVHHGPRNSYI